MRRRLCALILTLLPALACAEPEARFIPDSRFSESFPAKRDGSEVLIAAVQPSRSWVTIGRLTVRGDASSRRDELLAVARTKAAEAGADFIVIRDNDSETTRRQSGPAGAASGMGSLQRRGSGQILTVVPTLHATAAVFTRATLGIEYMDMGQTWGRPFVKAFRPNSPSEAAGMLPGDEILEADGIRPVGDDRFVRWLVTAQPGQTATLLVRRGESRLTLKVVLEAND